MKRRRRLRVAIASFTDGRSAGIPAGDRALARALEGLGHAAIQTAWSDPGVAWTAFDAVAVRSCWDYHLRPAAFLDWLARLEGQRVPVVNDPSLIRWNHDKRYLARLQASGLALPDTLWLEERQGCEVAAVCRERAARAVAAARERAAP